MIILHAEQLIYTRLEPTYSPQNRSGFQTAYAGTGLTPTEVGEIERRVQCFQQMETTRYQFFRLTGGKVVLTHTIAIAPDQEIVDKAGRRGAFLAHCLIFTPGEFKNADYNPFAIFDGYEFTTDIRKAVGDFGTATGTAPIERVHLAASSLTPALGWLEAEEKKLASLAMQAEELTRATRSVVLIGTADQIEAALRVALTLTPVLRRHACTFDTAVDRCPTPPGTYWAIGRGSRQDGGTAFIEVNLAQGRVAAQVIELADSTDLYLAWFNQTPLPTVLQQAPTVQKLAQAFVDRKDVALDQLDKTACAGFLQLHKSRILQELAAAVAVQVSKPLAVPLAEYISRIFGADDPRQLLIMVATQSVSLQNLSGWAVDWLVTAHPDLAAQDYKALQALGRKSANMRLLHLAATFGKKVDTAARDEALQQMNAGTFQAALDQLANPIAPAHFVTPAHLSALFDQVDTCPSLTSDQLFDLLRVLLEANQTDYITYLVRFLTSTDSRKLDRIEKLIKDRLNIPLEFQDAVAARREAVGPSSILQRVTGILHLQQRR